MEILHINPSTNNAHMFDKIVDHGKHFFVLIYMEGCGPCNATRPEWTKIQNILGNQKEKMKYPDVVIVDVDQAVTNDINHISSLSGFPTMRYISGKGKVIENYENDRSIDAFINWIDSKHGNFVDSTPSSSSFQTMTHTKSVRGTGQGRSKHRRSSRFSRRNKHTRRRYKKAGWKWKPRNKRKN